MKRILGIFLLVGLAFGLQSFYAGIHSHLLIKANEQFVLGGNKHGQFKVKAQNKLDVAFDVAERYADGRVVVLTTLKKGDVVKHTFAANVTALFINRSDKQAEADVHITGDVGLDMTYSAPQ